MLIIINILFSEYKYDSKIQLMGKQWTKSFMNNG